MPMRAESCGRARSRVASVEVGEPALDGERGAHRALGVVLLRVRIAEEGHQTIAEPFNTWPPKPVTA